jgi:hypothetical protein
MEKKFNTNPNSSACGKLKQHLFLRSFHGVGAPLPNVMAFFLATVGNASS